MTDQVERTLVDWLGEGSERGPGHGLERALAATRRTSQRPGWTFPEKWLPMPASVSRRTVLLGVLALLMAAVVTAVLIVAAPRPAPLPITVSVATTGPVVYSVDGDILLADPDGRNPRALTDDDAEDLMPVWSPDGSRIAFWSGQPNPDANSRMRYIDSSLWVVNADGSGRVRVVLWQGERRPQFRWTPDGRELVMWGAEGIDAVSVETGARRRIVTSAPVSVGEFVWSPDASLIAFDGTRVTASGGEDRRLYVVNADGTGLTAVSPKIETDRNLGYELGQFSWLPDGSGLLYSKLDATRITGSAGDIRGRMLVMAKRTASGWREEPLLGPDARTSWDFSPAISNDGRRVAFLRSPRDRGSGESELWVADLASREARRVTSGLFHSQLCWTPGDDGIGTLVQTAIDGGDQVTRVFDPEGFETPIDLPRGTIIHAQGCAIWQTVR